jgi:hypothetical protein
LQRKTLCEGAYKGKPIVKEITKGNLFVKELTKEIAL